MLSDQQRFYLETDAHFIPTPAKYKNEAPFLKEVDNQALIQEHNKLSQAEKCTFSKWKNYTKKFPSPLNFSGYSAEYKGVGGYPAGERSDGHIPQRHRFTGAFFCSGEFFEVKKLHKKIPQPS